MSALGDGLVSFWLGVALVVVTLVGALGWAAAFALGGDHWGLRKERRGMWRRLDAQQHRLRELRHINSRLVDRIRDVEPKGGKR